MKNIILLFILVFSSRSFAAVTITDLSGYSTSTGPFTDATLTIHTVYGGIGGSESDCVTKDTINTCNSCVGTPTDCNTTRIYSNLNLTISFKSDSTDGRVLVTNDSDESQISLDYSNVVTTNTITKDNIVTVKVLWSEICSELFGGSGTNPCDNTVASDLSTKIRVGFDTGDFDGELSSSDDFAEVQVVLADMSASDTTLCSTTVNPATTDIACNFIAYPGDQKAYIDDIRVGCTFPASSSSEADIKKIRILYAKDAYPTKNTATYADFIVNNDSQACTTSKVIGTANNEIKDLENDQAYFFSMALVDQANNVGFFTQHSGDLTTKNDTTTCFDSDQWKQNCHIATPTKVVGLLEDEFDCFITTATYGSPFKPKVKAFRSFRNLFLKPNVFGQLIIKTYYAVSPPIASWIRSNPQSKPVIRVLLWPYWLVSKIILLGSKNVALLLALLFFILSFRFHRIKKSKGSV